MWHALERGHCQCHWFADAFKRQSAIDRRNFITLEIDFTRGKFSSGVLGGIQKVGTLYVFVEQGVAGINRFIWSIFNRYQQFKSKKVRDGYPTGLIFRIDDQIGEALSPGLRLIGQTEIFRGFDTEQLDISSVALQRQLFPLPDRQGGIEAGDQA
jgi:hypothetical protein